MPFLLLFGPGSCMTIIMEGVLPSLAGGEWPGTCDFYCDGWFALPACFYCTVCL